MRHLQEQHQTEIKHIRDELRTLSQRNQRGLTEFDVMTRFLDKAERALYNFGLEASRFYDGFREDQLQRQAIQMGVSLNDFKELLGEKTTPEISRRDRLELGLLEAKQRDGQHAHVLQTLPTILFYQSMP